MNKLRTKRILDALDELASDSHKDGNGELGLLLEDARGIIYETIK